jgi:hypothetical protein
VIQNGIGNMIFILGATLFALFQNHILGMFFAVIFYYIGLSFITFSHVMAFNPSPKKPSISSSLSTGGFTRSQRQRQQEKQQSNGQSQTMEFVKVVPNDSGETKPKQNHQKDSVAEKNKDSGNSDTSSSTNG